MIAVVDQADLAAGTKALAEQLVGEVGLAQEHALLAIASHGQAVQLNRRSGGGDGRQGLFE